MYVFKIQYIFLRDQGEDKEVVEFVVAPNIGVVWKYYKQSIEQENIEFGCIIKMVPILKVLQEDAG